MDQVKRFKIIKEYKTAYREPIVLNAKETVILGEEEKEAKWKGWIWAENEIDEGWVPINLLEISDDKKTARVLEFY